MLALVGEISAVEKPYISAKDKKAGNKAESLLSKPPDVRFKTQVNVLIGNATTSAKLTIHHATIVGGNSPGAAKY
ncbi:MAG TPA: hypothetical protein VGY91_01065 [Chthoniobacterales bacterium]|jgi:hypothetical protein|nr:hypothetical protein [Chthoniobacterales bacterium]